MNRIVSSNQFEKEVLNSKDLVLVDFSAAWCGPCKMLAPVIEDIENELDGKLKVYTVDIDQCRDIANEFYITSVPTVMMLKNGEIVDKSIGFMPKEKIMPKIQYQLSK